MKKAYMKPATLVIAIQQQGIICGSQDPQNIKNPDFIPDEYVDREEDVW